MKYQREREKKFVVNPGREKEAIEAMFQLCKSDYVSHWSDTSTDKFWESKGVDFIRLRASSLELTVKVTDKGTVMDRIEENVVIASEAELEVTERFLNLVHGKAKFTLTKDFAVFTGIQGTVISLYAVNEDPKRRVFIEVEGESLSAVNKALKILRPQLPPMKQELRSLYQIFKEEGVK